MLNDVKGNESPPPATPAQDCFCAGACAQPDIWVPMVPAQTGSFVTAQTCLLCSLLQAQPVAQAQPPAQSPTITLLILASPSS